QFFVDLTGTSIGTAIARPSATGTIADDDATSIGINDVTVNENAGNANFTVTLSNPSQSTVTATYSTANRSASSPGDFTAQTSKTVNVVVNGDTSPESDETFTLNLSAPSEATVSGGPGTGTILDDDTVATQGGLAISDTTISEGDRGSRSASFTVSLSQAS